MQEAEYEKARKEDTERIISSKHPRRVLMAGPGTGKSFLLAEAIKEKKKQGKSKFHAITFIGKLGDALADDLAGLASVTTLHSFARKLVLDHRPKGWSYLPYIKKIIIADLIAVGEKNVDIGSEQYEERTKYYKAIGDDDVIYYAKKLLEESKKNLPDLDMLLIDEFQDFNEVESEFISLLAEDVEVLIVGDDDQALYRWKKADPQFIREKHSDKSGAYESHTLKWCSRCPEVVIDAFHDLVEKYSGMLSGRTKKEYLYYLPDKKKDSDANPKLILVTSQYRSIAQNIQKELERILSKQKIKSVLIIGEARTCGRSMLPSIAKVLKESGFKNIDYKDQPQAFTLNRNLFDGYTYLKKDNNLVLGWRLIGESLPVESLIKLIVKSFNTKEGIAPLLSDDFKKRHTLNAASFNKLKDGTPSVRKAVADSSIESLQRDIVIARKPDKDLLTEQIIKESHFLKAPLANLDITVCSITQSKGLGADVVFVVGFDQEKLPFSKDPTEDEVYHMLVALTRTKKRFYMVNTFGVPVSNFLKAFKPERYEVGKFSKW